MILKITWDSWNTVPHAEIDLHHVNEHGHSHPDHHDHDQHGHTH